MKDDKLFERLDYAYSDKNLNRITSKIIELYKNKHFDSIREISVLVFGAGYANNEKINKSFSRLIMQFHPDKAAQYRNEIMTAANNNDLTELERFSSILLLNDIDTISVPAEVNDVVEFESQYKWEKDEDGFNYFSEIDEENNTIDEDELFVTEADEDYQYEITGSFFNAVKRKYYGYMDVELPTYYLEDIDTIEMTAYEITNLDGIEYCKHVVNLDLSDNQISEISELKSLEMLEEIYLSGNMISDIDSLGSLDKLRVIDLSGNNIEDISPLFALENLEYVNLVGNKLRKHQVERLKEKKIIVVY